MDVSTEGRGRSVARFRVATGRHVMRWIWPILVGFVGTLLVLGAERFTTQTVQYTEDDVARVVSMLQDCAARDLSQNAQVTIHKNRYATLHFVLLAGVLLCAACFATWMVVKAWLPEYIERRNHDKQNVFEITLLSDDYEDEDDNDVSNKPRNASLLDSPTNQSKDDS